MPNILYTITDKRNHWTLSSVEHKNGKEMLTVTCKNSVECILQHRIMNGIVFVYKTDSTQSKRKKVYSEKERERNCPIFSCSRHLSTGLQFICCEFVGLTTAKESKKKCTHTMRFCYQKPHTQNTLEKFSGQKVRDRQTDTRTEILYWFQHMY